jgi:hypothetical protein
MLGSRSKTTILCGINVIFLFFTACSINNPVASKATSGSLTMVVDGTTVTYQAISSSCSRLIGFSCDFSASGSAADYPQIRFFFSRDLASGTSFTTASSNVIFGDSVRYYENSCQVNAGSAYRSYDTNGTVQVSISEFRESGGATDVKFSFSGIVYRTSPAYSKSITSGSLNLYVKNGGDSSAQTSTPSVTAINRNQLYSGISIGQKESKCYVFTPPTAQTYAVTVSSAVTVNPLNFNFGYSTSGSSSSGGCSTAGNGTCNLIISTGGFPTSLEVMAGNNLAGSFSMQITP